MLWAGLVVVLAGAVVWQVTLGRGTGSTAPRAPAQPSEVGSTSLQVAEACAVHRGDGTVEVTFRLVNRTGKEVRLVTVTPRLPVAGLLRPLSSTLGPGTCSPGLPASADGRLPSGDSTGVTFRFAPVVRCPQPAPVRALVLVEQDGFRISHELPVLSDLGILRIAGCP